MDAAAASASTTWSDYARLAPRVLLLAAPVVVEQLLHALVSVNDTYLANNLVITKGLTGAELDAALKTNHAAGAAVGSVVYVLWFVGLLASSIGIGATALISRATGGRHKSLANKVVGQTLLAALVIGSLFGVTMSLCAAWIAPLTGLQSDAQPFFVEFVQIIGFVLPLAIVMMASASCLRGGGDTLSPALAVMVVDVVNFVVCLSLVRGYFGLPEMGFKGIAIGTAVAYSVGAVLQVGLLIRGRSRVRLYPHRLRPNLAILHRIFRIGLPSGAELVLQWIANIGVLYAVNRINNTSAAAHLIAIRMESFSFLTGMGFATAASTLVGQSLGMLDPQRARKCAWLAYAMGGGAMTVMGLCFVVFGPTIAGWMVQNDPELQQQAGNCLRMAGLVQSGFAAAMIFGGALRGAGDTVAVMKLNLASIIGVRLVGVLIVTQLFGFGLLGVWAVLCGELMLRGCLMMGRFQLGSWQHRKV
jgi:putative MATE family efflux protein